MASLAYTQARKLSDLLIEADPEKKLQVRILSTSRLALGEDVIHRTKVIDLTKETVVTYAAINTEKMPEPIGGREPEQQKRFRQSGKYYIELRGDIIPCRSLKEALAVGL